LLLLNPSLEHSQRPLSSFYKLLNLRVPLAGPESLQVLVMADIVIKTKEQADRFMKSLKEA
jgi:hypothetical protein